MTARVLALMVASALVLGVGLWLRNRTPSAGGSVRSTVPADGRRETFSVTYTVEIRPHDPGTAWIRWELAGVDEVARLRLKLDAERFGEFRGSGVIEQDRSEVRWTPGAPYAHLSYRVSIDHRHGPGKGYDSYVGDGWIISRMGALFPRSTVTFRTGVEPSPESRARLVFRLPAGWDVATVMPPAGSRAFVVESPRSRFDHPRGWLVLGRFRRADATIAGTAVTVAASYEAPLSPGRVIRFIEKALPALAAIFAQVSPRLLIVSGPDPMWHGGLSGEQSFYIHAARPLRTPDRTSPYLHELFHVLAPFRPAPDARWVTEGLAELYSLDIQRRVGRLDDQGYAKGLHLFRRYGAWGSDFTRKPNAAVLNNSAPLIMHVLDRRIRRVTNGLRGLDDVVAALASEGGVVSTARFLGTVRRVAGKSFGDFFRRHVYRGERPAPDDLPPLGLAPERPATTPYRR